MQIIKEAGDNFLKPKIMGVQTFQTTGVPLALF